MRKHPATEKHALTIGRLKRFTVNNHKIKIEKRNANLRANRKIVFFLHICSSIQKTLSLPIEIALDARFVFCSFVSVEMDVIFMHVYVFICGNRGARKK